jgi:hypothetical protein
MPIQYIANDPFAAKSAPQIRTQPKRPNRPAGRAGFTFSATAPEKLYEPGTPGFLYWQCRESVLAAMEAWEAFAGNLSAWQGKRKRLPLVQDGGVDLNAYYDRDSFSFFHQRVGTRTFFSGESVDVVAHEVGHGLLDAIRPELWDASFLEAGAFHESFGDCVAILTALDDRDTRVKLLAVSKTLKKRNFVESTIELLAAGTKALEPGHNAAAPRHAYNTLKYQIPSTLPSNGGPGALINEVHSFGMVFTGCFYDVIVGLFAAQSTKTEKTLLAAARKAGRLLVRAAQTAVVTPRFFQSVGRAMVLADDEINGGAHRQIIKDAFGRHAIVLGANALLGATAVLAGAARTAKSRGLSSATKRDLAARLGVSAATRFSVGAVDLAGHSLDQVVHTRRVPLGSVHKKLAGVSIDALVPVLLGASGGRAAVMGDMPAVVSTEEEVKTFAESLLRHGQIEFAGTAKAAAAMAGAGAAHGAVSSGHRRAARETHRVTTVGNARMLVRVRFSCGCHR